MDPVLQTYSTAVHSDPVPCCTVCLNQIDPLPRRAAALTDPLHNFRSDASADFHALALVQDHTGWQVTLGGKPERGRQAGRHQLQQEDYHHECTETRSGSPGGRSQLVLYTVQGGRSSYSGLILVE